MDLARLKQLIELAATSPLREIEVTEGGVTIRIARHPNTTPVRVAPPVVRTATATQSGSPPLSDPGIVPSPLFGIVHLTPAPNSPPFVRKEDLVEIGQQLCLVEAMKVFNPILSPVSGRVTEILVETGSEVARAQPLFRIVPAERLAATAPTIPV